MNAQPCRQLKGFTHNELLVLVLLLSSLSIGSFPVFSGTMRQSQQNSANANAKAISEAIKQQTARTGTILPTLSSYASELGGSIPLNPCTSSGNGYMLTTTPNSATVTAVSGSGCGDWTPAAYTVKFER